MGEEQNNVNNDSLLKKKADLENKDKNNTVLDENKKLLDLDGILQSNKYPVVGKLNNLKEFGVTNEHIKRIFERTGIVAKDIMQALRELNIIFLILAEKISKDPNGIVINLKTGEIDEEKSRRQREQLKLDEEISIEAQSVEIGEAITKFIESMSPQELKRLSYTSHFRDMSKITDEEFNDFFAKRSERLAAKAAKESTITMDGQLKKSDVRFKRKDEKDFNDLYATYTVNSYLSSEKELEDIGNAIFDLNVEDFDSEVDPNDPNKVNKEKSIAYVESRMNAELLGEFLYIAENRPDFESLSKEDKKTYIERIFAAKAKAEETLDPKLQAVLAKISNAALELMNTDGKQFIRFTKNGEAIIDQQLILAEYNMVRGDSEEVKTPEELTAQSLQSYTKGKLFDIQSDIMNRIDLMKSERNPYIYEDISDISDDLFEQLARIKLIREKEKVNIQQNEELVAELVDVTGNNLDKNNSDIISEARKNIVNRIIENDIHADIETSGVTESIANNEAPEVAEAITNNENYKITELNNAEPEKYGLLDRIKGMINSFRQSKISDGNAKENRKGIISKAIEGIKALKNKGNEEKSNKDMRQTNSVKAQSEPENVFRKLEINNRDGSFEQGAINKLNNSDKKQLVRDDSDQPQI